MNQQKVWRIKFYGVRGSTPVCEPNYQCFGGNTTSINVELLTDHQHKMVIIIDAGTGIRKLGQDILSGKIPKSESIFLIFSHFHWDHIQGLPFFSPAYNPDKKVAIFSPHHQMKDCELKQIFEVQMQKEYFPVQLNKMGAEIKFFTAEEYKSYLKFEQTVEFNYRKHNHPGGAFSYRFEAEGKSVVICTDLEHGTSIDQEVINFAKNADILVHDAQYTDEELKSHRGWGHSSYVQAIETAKRANVKRLILTHHDPEHDDDFLTAMEQDCQQKFSNCFLAREGMEFII